MRRNSSERPALLVALLFAGGVFTAAGCGRKVDLASVEGKVTLGGQPLSGVVVTFFPVSEGSTGLPDVSATTDAAGKYRIEAADGTSGAVVGKNRVVVDWPPRVRSDEGAPPPPKPTAVIPLQYTVAGMTPFIVEVRAGAQTIDFPLVP